MQAKDIDRNFCAKCGACTAVCPVYQVTGQESLTARGRLHLLDKLGDAPLSEEFLAIFSKCLLCGACRNSCPRRIDLPAVIAEARREFPRLSGRGSFSSSLLRKCFSSSRLLAGMSTLLKKLPRDSGLRLKLGITETAPEPGDAVRETGTGPRGADGRTASLFPGCFARYLDPEAVGAAGKLTGAEGQDAQVCCGIAAYSGGDIDEARRLARANISAYSGTDGPVIVLCGSCYSHLSRYPELLADDPDWSDRAATFAARLREFSDYLADREKTALKDRTTSPVRVLYHDPCHLRHSARLREAPREILRDIPGVTLVEPEHGPQCCGLGGLFNLAHPDLSDRIAGSLVADIVAADPDLVVTTCSGCLIQLRDKLAKAGSRAKVSHLSGFLAGRARPRISVLPTCGKTGCRYN